MFAGTPTSLSFCRPGIHAIGLHQRTNRTFWKLLRICTATRILVPKGTWNFQTLSISQLLTGTDHFEQWPIEITRAPVKCSMISSISETCFGNVTGAFKHITNWTHPRDPKFLRGYARGPLGETFLRTYIDANTTTQILLRFGEFPRLYWKGNKPCYLTFELGKVVCLFNMFLGNLFFLICGLTSTLN